MKANFKKYNEYAFLTIMLFITSLCFSQTISFEPYGMMDKPLPRIEIRMGTAKDSLKEFTFEKRNHKTVYIYYFETSTFDLIKETITKYDTKIKYNSKNNYEYGTYKVSVNDDNAKLEYMLISSENSYKFFNQLFPLIKSNDRLREEISLLLKRLD